jgi:putative transposase
VPRVPRSFIAGGLYHVFSRGNRKQAIFISDRDRTLFLALLRKIKTRRRWTLHGYCLMQNHYHLVVETPEPDLSVGMRHLNGEYAQWFNREYGFVGHLFQGRFQAIQVESDGHLLELSRYLALNPVSAGLCLAPTLWPWSSFAETLRPRTTSLVSAKRVLAFFGPDEERAAKAFRTFVEDGPSGPFRTLGSDPGVDKVG